MYGKILPISLVNPMGGWVKGESELKRAKLVLFLAPLENISFEAYYNQALTNVSQWKMATNDIREGEIQDSIIDDAGRKRLRFGAPLFKEVPSGARFPFCVMVPASDSF